MVEKQITLAKQYLDRYKKTLQYGKILTIFPSVNFKVNSRLDVKAVIKNNSPYINGVTVPISFAEKFVHILSGYNKDEQERFYNSLNIVTDFETESWFKANKTNVLRKRAFSSIPSLPSGWDKLFTIPKEGDKKKYFGEMKRDYIRKLKTFFGQEESDDSTIIKFVTACMSYASNKISSNIPLPPATLIVGEDASLAYCLKINKIYNKFRAHFNLFKVVYYPLHISVLEKHPQVLRAIINQIYELSPDIVYFSTTNSHEFLFPQNVYNPKKTDFKIFASQLAEFSKTNASVVGWYDKGDFSSSYGLELIRIGFDTFIYPLKGHSMEGGYGTDGPKYAYTLDEYAYCGWLHYLKNADKHYINNIKTEELHALTPHQQWEYKRDLEIKTRSMQFDHIHKKLEEDGSLIGFEVRLKQNKIE